MQAVLTHRRFAEAAEAEEGESFESLLWGLDLVFLVLLLGLGRDPAAVGRSAGLVVWSDSSSILGSSSIISSEKRLRNAGTQSWTQHQPLSPLDRSPRLSCNSNNLVMNIHKLFALWLVPLDDGIDGIGAEASAEGSERGLSSHSRQAQD